MYIIASAIDEKCNVGAPMISDQRMAAIAREPLSTFLEAGDSMTVLFVDGPE